MGDLLTSFDGMTVFRPWQRNMEWRTRDAWWHTDQRPFPSEGYTGPVSNDREYVQGLVNLITTTPATGGFVLLPRSHRQWDSIAERFWDEKRHHVNYYRMAKREPEAFTGAICAHLEAGDLLCWDSRTIHGSKCGAATSSCVAPTPSTSSVMLDNQLLRVAIFVCMGPRSRMTDPEILEERRKAVENGWTTGHSLFHERNLAESWRQRTQQ